MEIKLKLRRYPFPSMKPGNSFQIPNGKLESIRVGVIKYCDRNGIKRDLFTVTHNRCWFIGKQENIKVEIEHNIPYPGKDVNCYKYPFDKMRIGDSFLVTLPNSGLYSTASRYGSRHSMRFTIRKLEKGIMRCWRIL